MSNESSLISVVSVPEYVKKWKRIDDHSPLAQLLIQDSGEQVCKKRRMRHVLEYGNHSPNRSGLGGLALMHPSKYRKGDPRFRFVVRPDFESQQRGAPIEGRLSPVPLPATYLEAKRKRQCPALLMKAKTMMTTSYLDALKVFSV